MALPPFHSTSLEYNARVQIGELVAFMLDHLPIDAVADEEAITWDPRNLSLRETTCIPTRLR